MYRHATPRWVQRAPGVSNPSWMSIIQGTTVEVVKLTFPKRKT